MGAKSSSGKKKSPQTLNEGQSALSSELTETSYQGLEFLLIGFASVLITFLWVGVFSTILQNRQVRFSFLGDSPVSEVARNMFSQTQDVVQRGVNLSSLAKDTIVYQFVALWESSCITQGSCTGGFRLVSTKLVGFSQSLAGLLGHSHRVVLAARDILSFRIFESGTSVARLFSIKQAYADSVLGEKTVSTAKLLQKSIQGYYGYVDRITFGAVTAINPGLVGRE